MLSTLRLNFKPRLDTVQRPAGSLYLDRSKVVETEVEAPSNFNQLRSLVGDERPASRLVDSQHHGFEKMQHILSTGDLVGDNANKVMQEDVVSNVDSQRRLDEYDTVSYAKRPAWKQYHDNPRTVGHAPTSA